MMTARSSPLLRPLVSGGLLGLVLLGLGACGGGVDPTAETVEADPGIWLWCDDPVRDFGDVIEGAELSGSFTLEHRGPDPIELVSMRVSCGCTGAVLERPGPDGPVPVEEGDTIQPGEVLTLGVTYQTRGKVGPTPREVSIYTTQPSGKTTLTLKADVHAWFEVDPPDTEMRVVRLDQETRFEHRVRSANGEVFRIEPTGVGIPPELVPSVAPVDPDQDGRAAEWIVTTVLSPGLPRGSYVWPIHLRSDRVFPDLPPLPDGTQLFIEATPGVAVKLVGLVEADPPSLTFMGVSPGQTIARTVRIRSHDPDFVLPEPGLRLVPAKEGQGVPLAKTATLSARPVEGENAWDVQVLLSGLDDEVDYWFSAKLIVETGHPREPEVVVKIGGRRTGGWAR